MEQRFILTTQYKVYNDRRLHFARMFWQNIALHIIGVMTIFLFWELSPGQLSNILILCIGPASILMAFIAWRLQKLERAYENHLKEIENYWARESVAGIQSAALSGRLGARILVVLILALGGIVLTIASAIPSSPFTA